MIVACLALVDAIGGAAYAGSKINGKQIKRNTVTGRQVKESTLRNVASAKKAKAAKSAEDADTLGGLKPGDLKVRWLLINEKGQIEEQSGGFTVLDAYVTNDDLYIDAGEPTLGHGLFATIALQNRIDVYSPGPTADPNSEGEVSIARCQTAAVECAPAGAKNGNAFVVSPRNSDGSATAGTAANPRKRVYVEFTE